MEKTGRRFEAGTCTGTRDGMSYSHTRDSCKTHCTRKTCCCKKHGLRCTELCHCDLQLCENKSVVDGSDSSEDEDATDEQFSD